MPIKGHCERSILSESDRDFIFENYKCITVAEICKALNKHSHTIYDFMSDNGLDVYTKPRLKKNNKVEMGYFDDSKDSYDFLLIGDYHK
jgi:hypothetical protein